MAARLPNPFALQRLLNKPALLLQQTQTTTSRASIPTLTLAARRTYSSSSDLAPPPLLTKMKGDLKTAMRAKDATRLAVLRAIFAANLNASKTASPVRTDAQLVALLRKTARASQDAAAGFRDADRADLAEKEEAQIRILDEYVGRSGIQSLDAEALRELAVKAREEVVSEGGAVNLGAIMKRLNAPGGVLEGKDYDKTELPRVVKEVAAL